MRHSSPKNIVITGASAGAGRATAIAFARQGCNIGLIARGAERLENAKADAEAAGGTALALPADVSDAQAVEHGADRMADTWGSNDAWVNCAMVTVFSPVREFTAEEYRRDRKSTRLHSSH